jgi:hypothetical protein
MAPPSFILERHTLVHIPKIYLIFDGLDTAATIFLGGKPTVFANGLFR